MLPRLVSPFHSVNLQQLILRQHSQAKLNSQCRLSHWWLSVHPSSGSTLISSVSNLWSVRYNRRPQHSAPPSILRMPICHSNALTSHLSHWLSKLASSLCFRFANRLILPIGCSIGKNHRLSYREGGVRGHLTLLFMTAGLVFLFGRQALMSLVAFLFELGSFSSRRRLEAVAV